MGGKCNCFAKLSPKDPRFQLWKKVVPDGRIPIKHPLTGEHPHFKGVMCYEGDPSRLTKEQKEILIEELARKFNEPKSHVREGLKLNILPVRADNTLVEICDLHFRCMM